MQLQRHSLRFLFVFIYWCWHSVSTDFAKNTIVCEADFILCFQTGHWCFTWHKNRSGQLAPLVLSNILRLRDYKTMQRPLYTYMIKTNSDCKHL